MTNLLTNARNRNKIKHDILFLSPDWAAEVSKVSQQNITTEIQSKSWGKSCLRSPKSSICGKELLWMPMFQMCFWMGCPMVKEADIEEVQREEREVETNCANNLESLVETQEMDWRSWLYIRGKQSGREWGAHRLTSGHDILLQLYRRTKSSKTLKRLSLSLQSWKLINAALSSCNPRYRETVLLVKPNFCLFASDYILKIYLSRK